MLFCFSVDSPKYCFDDFLAAQKPHQTANSRMFDRYEVLEEGYLLVLLSDYIDYSLET